MHMGFRVSARYFYMILKKTRIGQQILNPHTPNLVNILSAMLSCFMCAEDR
jgi:hypothetical protein